MRFLLQWSSFSAQKGQSSPLLTVPKGLSEHNAPAVATGHGHRTSWCAALNQTSPDICMWHLTNHTGTVHSVLGATGAFSTRWHCARGHWTFSTLWHWNCTYMPSHAWCPQLSCFPAFRFLHVFSQTHIQTILLLALHTMCFKCHTACSTMPKTFCPSLTPKYS